MIGVNPGRMPSISRDLADFDGILFSIDHS